VFNYLLGSLSRIFTTVQEISDPIILYGYIAGFALNAVLAAQMIYYWNSPSTRVRSKRGLPYSKTTISSSAKKERKEALEHISTHAHTEKTHHDGITHIQSNLGEGEVKEGPWPGPDWAQGGTTGASPGRTTTRRRG